MPAELTALALAALLQTLQIGGYALAARQQVGVSGMVGPRDNAPVLTGKAGRLKRAMENHFEGLILFTIAVVVVTLSDKAGGRTAICAWTYLVARILFIPAYVYAWAPWRSIIWGVGFFATWLMLVTSLI